MKRILLISTAACILLAAASASASAKDTWISVRSKNFFLIGNGGEKQVRQVATRLEQFRDVFTRLFSQAKFNSPVPTTVVVFKDDSSFRPFKPGNVAGYFQSGPDINYIALSAESSGGDEDDPFRVIFHEYVHLLVNNTMGGVPVWFNEGLAEYYSTFYIDDERKAFLGKIISNHVLYLREQKMLPFKTLFTVDHRSPHYNERGKQGVFYAESWALVHYLLQGKDGARAPQLGAFLGQLGAGVPLETAFKNAFNTEFEMLEKELKEYVKNSNYRSTRVTFERKLEFDTEMQSAPISESDALAYLGDLSMHLGDLAGAEKRLSQALAIEPGHAMANSSLGLVRVRQRKFAEARPLLEKAVAANSQNYMVHYNYAFALSVEGAGEGNMISGFSPATADLMRAELKKAIELSPTFPESYRLLAFVNLVTGDHLDESIIMLKRGLALSPGNGEFSFLLAQLYLRKQDFKGVRQTLEPLVRNNGTEPQLRSNAQSLLDTIARMEGQMSGGMESAEAGSSETGDNTSSPPAGPPRLRRRGEASGAPRGSDDPDVVLSDRGYSLPIRKPEAGEAQEQGILVRVDCDQTGAVTFTVKVGERLIKLRTADMSGVRFVSYLPQPPGDMSCGPRKSEEVVVVTFRPAKDPRAKISGELVSMEFVPKEFELKK